MQRQLPLRPILCPRDRTSARVYLHSRLGTVLCLLALSRPRCQPAMPCLLGHLLPINLLVATAHRELLDEARIICRKWHSYPTLLVLPRPVNRHPDLVAQRPCRLRYNNLFVLDFGEVC